MDNRFTISLLVIGLIACLVACQPKAIVAPETTVPAPSQVPASETAIPAPSEVPTSETIIPSPLPGASEGPIEFDCDTAREIAVRDCRALVTLFESTQGTSWKEHPGWLELDTPATGMV